MEAQPEIILVHIFEYLDNESLMNILDASFIKSVHHMANERLPLIIIQQTCENRIFKNPNELKNQLKIYSTPKALKFKLCSMKTLSIEALPSIPSLTSISFEKCDGNLVKAFKNQVSVEKIIIMTPRNLSREIFFEIIGNLPALKHIRLMGKETQNYLQDCEIYAKIESLNIESINYGFYFMNNDSRLKFFESQSEHLRKLIIDEFPYDFNGGKILNYFIDKMNLTNFYCGGIPLIVNAIKQDVVEIDVNELQMEVLHELVRRYPSLKFIKLKLSVTDVASDEIEKLFSETTVKFDNIQTLEVNDASSYRRLLGIFNGFFKKLKNLRKLSVKTEDKNVNAILDECLPFMLKLNEIILHTSAPRDMERLEIIRDNVENLKKLSVSEMFVEKAKNFFENSNVEIFTTTEYIV